MLTGRLPTLHCCKQQNSPRDFDRIVPRILSAQILHGIPFLKSSFLHFVSKDSCFWLKSYEKFSDVSYRFVFFLTKNGFYRIHFSAEECGQ